MALLAIFLILFLKGKNFLRKVLFILAIYIGLHFLPAKQIERFNTMGDDQTSQLRLVHWENAIDVIQNNPLGIGYYNWAHYYPTYYDVVKYEEIHNTILQAMVELGYHGGILFALMIIIAFVMNAKTIREMDRFDNYQGEILAAIARGINLGLLGSLIAALFMSVLFYPVFWLAFALTSALRHISIKQTIERLESVHNNSPLKRSSPLRKQHYKHTS